MSWIELERQVLTGTAASVTLGNGGTLNQGYKTLKVVVSSRTATGGRDYVVAAFNGSSANFTARLLRGDGTNAISAAYSMNYVGLSTGATEDTASTFSNWSMELRNYASSTASKPYTVDFVGENNASGTFMGFWAGLWSITNAITSITLTNSGGASFAIGTTVSLFGLK